MNEKEVVEFVDRHGYNPDLRDSGHSIVLTTHRGVQFYGLGVHVVRDADGTPTSLLLLHDHGRMHFWPYEVRDISWVLPAPQVLAAIA